MTVYMEVCKQNVTFSEQNPNFLSSTIICDESWYIHYVPESKQHPAVQKQKLASPEEISHVAFICASVANIF
jgi:hypothetical protein